MKKSVPSPNATGSIPVDLAEFAARTEHACRTPLSIALTSVELLQKYHDRLTPEAREQHLANIHGAVLQLTSMLDEIIRPAGRSTRPALPRA